MLREFKFTDIADIQYENNTQEPYRYFFSNPAASGRRINILPTPQVTSDTIMKVWFIRNAKLLTTGADVLDIPEFANFILSYTKFQVLKKEGDPRIEIEAMELAAQRKLMVDTLTEMVPDEDNTIPADVSHYEEHQ